MCGLPLASELTGKIFQEAYPDDEELSGPMRKIHQNWLKLWFPDCDFSTNWPDFEQLLTVIREYDEYGLAYGEEVSKDALETTRHLRETLLKALCKLLFQKGSVSDLPYSEHVKKFIRFALETRAIVISFNWDLILELSCEANSQEWTYEPEKEDHLGILKPHGSINLVELSKVDWDKAKNGINIYDLETMLDKDNQIVLRGMSTNDALHRVIYPFKSCLIVEPNTRKQYSSIWIKNQWRRSLDLLRTCNEIYIIGYSLPEADVRPRLLIRLSASTENRNLPIFVVSPNAKSKIDHFRRQLGSNVKPITESWPDWLDQHILT